MNFQSIILSVYPKLLKRVQTWGLLLILFLLYGSAYCMRKPDICEFFSRIGLSSFHIFWGFILILASLLLAYDTFLKRPTQGGSGDSQYGSRFPLFRLKSPYYGSTIDRFFYGFLLLICFLGFLLYLVKRFGISMYVLNPVILLVLHETVGLLFLSIILIKYYLALTRWFGEVKSFLREQ